MRLAPLLLLVFAAPKASLVLSMPAYTPGMVTEYGRDLNIAATVEEYVDGKLSQRVNVIGFTTVRVRDELLEYDATHQRSRITFVRARAVIKVNNLTVPTPLPLEGKTYLVERNAQGRLLAGDAEGNPLSAAEAQKINQTLNDYGVRFDPVALTIGKPIVKQPHRDPEVDGIPIVVGSREVNGQQQIIFASLGKGRTEAGGIEVEGEMSGHLILGNDGTFETVNYGIGQLAKSERKRGHRVDTAGSFVLVIRHEGHPVASPSR